MTLPDQTTVKDIAELTFGPRKIVKRANDTVDWNERQIVDAIRQQARKEATNRWETIEFKL